MIQSGHAHQRASAALHLLRMVIAICLEKAIARIYFLDLPCALSLLLRDLRMLLDPLVDNVVRGLRGEQQGLHAVCLVKAICAIHLAGHWYLHYS